ncbi:Uncharacterised protein [Acinetobacter baumannii]|nr:Uncharacterised protein [Acinetobacter baumannii]
MPPVCASSLPTLGPTNSMRFTVAFLSTESLITPITLLPSSWPAVPVAGGMRTITSRLLPKFWIIGSWNPAFSSVSRIRSRLAGFSRLISITVPPVKSRPQLKPRTDMVAIDATNSTNEMPKAT